MRRGEVYWAVLALSLSLDDYSIMLFGGTKNAGR